MYINGSGGIEVTAEELRDIIKGNLSFRRCPDCVGKGYLMCNGETGEPWENQSQAESEVQDALGEDIYYEYPCDTCNSIGYIEVPE